MLAAIGILLISAGTFFLAHAVDDVLKAPESVWRMESGRMYFEWTGMWILSGVALGLAGSFFSIIGGLLAKPGSLWIPFISIGTIYCLPTLISHIYGTSKQLAYPAYYPDATYFNPGIIFPLLPGLILIIEAIVIRTAKSQAIKSGL